MEDEERVCVDDCRECPWRDDCEGPISEEDYKGPSLESLNGIEYGRRRGR